MLVSPAARGALLSDPAGDSTSPPGDIVWLRGVYDDDTLYLSAQFAPGSLDPQNLFFVIRLDIDLNPLTPASGPPDEVVIGFDASREPSRVGVVLEGGELLGLLPIQFGTDSFSISVPLHSPQQGELDEDGEVNFMLAVSLPPAQGAPIEVADFAPDSAEQGIYGGPTTYLPEPAAGPSAAVAVTCAALSARRRRWPRRQRGVQSTSATSSSSAWRAPSSTIARA